MGRERGEEALGEQGKGFKFAAANGQSENGEIENAGAEAVEENGRDFLDDAELRLRQLARKRREARWKKIGRDGGDDTDMNGAGDGILLRDDLAFGGCQFPQDRDS